MAGTSKGAPKTKRTTRAAVSRGAGCRWLVFGCFIAPMTLAFLGIVALLAAIPFALRREPLQPIEVTLETQGISWPTDTVAVATYISVLDLPAVPEALETQLREALAPRTLVPEVVHGGERISVVLPSAYTSIRSERLSTLRVNSITLLRTKTEPKSELPPSESEPNPDDNPLLYAEIDGSIARFSANAAFLPDPLRVSLAARQISMRIETDPVVLTGFRTGTDGIGWKQGHHEESGAHIEGRQLAVPAGRVVPIPLYRTGVEGFPPRPIRVDGEVATHVIAINEQILVETIGWRMSLEQIPLTAEELDTLYTLRDTRFPTAVELIDGGPVASIAIAEDAAGSVALLAFSVRSSDTLAGAGYLRLSVTSP